MQSHRILILILLSICAQAFGQTSFWSAANKPQNIAANDSDSVTLGLRFQANVPGQVTGVRFYKGSGNNGKHIGQLWTSRGDSIASVTFSNETSTGWQTARFASPVAIEANTTYVISYSVPMGHYSYNTYYPWSGLSNSSLRVSGSSPGVYTYGSGSRFPRSSWQQANYWVDVEFTPTGVTPPTPVEVSVNPSATTLNGGQTQQFSASVSGSSNTSVTWSVSPQIGTISANGLYTAPMPVSLSQTVTITARSAADATKSASAVVSLVATPPPPVVQISVSPSSKSLSKGQSQQFAASVTGSSNSAVTWSFSPQVGSLSANGLYTAPATVGVAQTVTITARSAADTTKTASAVVSLIADPPPPVQISVTPTSKSLNAGQSQQVAASVSGSSNSSVTWSFSPQVGTLSTNGLYTAPATVSVAQSVTITARSAADTTKTATATVSLVATPPPPTNSDILSFWPESTIPRTTDVANDSDAVTLGLRFSSEVSGEVVGVRFFKGSRNIGTHVGNLWSANGANLGEVIFTGETATGWQQAIFATPVPIVAGATYTVSYLAPRGGYAIDEQFDWSTANAGPLKVIAPGAGVYAYGSNTRFPASTWRGSNYWVDVIFVPTVEVPRTPPVETYTISGTVSGATSTVALSGPTSGTTTTDTTGKYSFTGLQSGLYVVAPSKAGFTFTPATKAVTLTSASVTNVNFVAVVVPPAASSVSLSWNPSATSDIVGYNIYRSGGGSGSLARINAYPISGTGYVDTNVVPGQAYTYVATAVDGSGIESSYSNQANAQLN